MPATVQYDPLSTPTRFLTGLEAVHAAMAALPNASALLNVYGSSATALIQAESSWPDGKKYLVVTSRGRRQPDGTQQVRGTTATEMRAAVLVHVVVRKDDPALAMRALDAAEVEVVNALRALQVVTRGEQEEWDLDIRSLTPVTARQEGGTFPYAGTVVELSVWQVE